MVELTLDRVNEDPLILLNASEADLEDLVDEDLPAPWSGGRWPRGEVGDFVETILSFQRIVCGLMDAPLDWTPIEAAQTRFFSILARHGRAPELRYVVTDGELHLERRHPERQGDGLFDLPMVVNWVRALIEVLDDRRVADLTRCGVCNTIIIGERWGPMKQYCGVNCRQKASYDRRKGSSTGSEGGASSPDAESAPS